MKFRAHNRCGFKVDYCCAYRGKNNPRGLNHYLCKNCGIFCYEPDTYVRTVDD